MKSIAQQAVIDYMLEQKKRRKGIVKFTVPFISFALACVLIFVCIARHYSTTYSDNLRSRLREEV